LRRPARALQRPGAGGAACHARALAAAGAAAAPPPSDASSASPAQLWAVMQLVDSGLPTGGFAHSAGLEAAWQQGRIHGLADLDAFVRAAVGQAAHSSVPCVTAAHALFADGGGGGGGLRGRLERWCAVDAGQHALLSTNEVACRASATQGAAYLVRPSPPPCRVGIRPAVAWATLVSRPSPPRVPGVARRNTAAAGRRQQWRAAVLGASCCHIRVGRW
jgi:hypothetical protein